MSAPGLDRGFVFVIDDDEPVRDSLRLFLEAFDFEVQDYPSCAEFLDGFGALSNGCVLLDLHQPVMSGLELVERFGDRLAGMPVIMMSSRADGETLARAQRAGIAAFLEKPFEGDVLLKTIRQAMSRPS